MIYFIQVNDTGPIKIGYAEKDMKTRLKNLQSSNPEQLHILGILQGDMRAEAQLHTQFCDHLIRGEWYNPEKPLLDYISRMCPEVKGTEIPETKRLYAKESVSYIERRKVNSITIPENEPRRNAWYDW